MVVRTKKTVIVENPKGDEEIKVRDLYADELNFGEGSAPLLKNLSTAIVSFKGFTDEDGNKIPVTKNNKRLIIESLIEDHSQCEEGEESFYDRLLGAVFSHKDSEK